MRYMQKKWQELFANSATFFFFGKFFLILLFLHVSYRLLGSFFWIEGNADFSILEASINGFRQDISVVSYQLLLISLVFIGASYTRYSGRFWLAGFLLMLITAYSVLIWISDAVILCYWGSHLNNQALMYLSYPAQLFNSVSSVLIFGSTLMILVLGIFGVRYFKRFVKSKMHLFESGTNKKYAIQALWLILLFILARGGVGKIPLSISQPQRSSSETTNKIAVNAFWNANYWLFSAPQYPEIEHLLSKQYYQSKYVQQYQAILGDTNSLLSGAYRPKNLVIIILEGVSAQTSNLLGGTHFNGLPLLDSWAKTWGRWSPHCYATGDRTDKGLASLFSGWPGQPWQGILHEPTRFQHLPHLANAMSRDKRRSSFYYGGDADFANIRAYMTGGGVQEIFSQKEMEIGAKPGNWGFHDSDVLQLAYRNLSREEGPYLTSILTLSSHEPYDIVSGGKSELNKYYQSVAYVDRSLDAFFKACFANSYFNETCFLIISDHGKYLQSPATHFGQREFFRIPFVLLGKGIQGLLPSLTDRCFSQADVYNSVLDLFYRERDPKAPYSRSIFRNNHPNNAFFNMVQVGGLISKESINWLSTDKMSITSEMPLNQWDSAILSLESEIISDFFKFK